MHYYKGHSCDSLIWIWGKLKFLSYSFTMLIKHILYSFAPDRLSICHKYIVLKIENQAQITMFNHIHGNLVELIYMNINKCWLRMRRSWHDVLSACHYVYVVNIPSGISWLFELVMKHICHEASSLHVYIYLYDVFSNRCFLSVIIWYCNSITSTLL